MVTTINPLDAVVLFLLIDACAWVGLMLYDSTQATVRMRSVSTPRLLLSAVFTITTSTLFYLKVEGATQVWVLVIHALLYGLFPFYLFYRDKCDRAVGVAYVVAALVFAAGTLEGLMVGQAHFVPTQLLLMLFIVLGLSDKLGLYQKVTHFYYTRPYYERWI